MTVKELKNQLMDELASKNVNGVHPLYEAMIDECCERALSGSDGKADLGHLALVKIGFISAHAMLRGLLKASLTQADFVTLNYRGRRFLIDRNSPVLMSHIGD